MSTRENDDRHAPDMEAMISKAAESAVKKVLLEAGIIEEAPDPDAPVTKAEIEQIVSDALAPMMKAGKCGPCRAGTDNPDRRRRERAGARHPCTGRDNTGERSRAGAGGPEGRCGAAAGRQRQRAPDGGAAQGARRAAPTPGAAGRHQPGRQRRSGKGEGTVQS